MGELLGVKLKHVSFDRESGDYPITFVLNRLAKRACFVWRRLLGRTPDDHTRKSPRRRPLPLPCTIPYRIFHRWQQGMHTVRGHICQLALASICPRVLVPSVASIVTKSCRSPSTIHFLAAITLLWLLRIARHSNAMRPLAPMNFVK